MGTPDIAESPRPYKIYSPSLFALALSRLEAAYENPARFEAFCHGFRQRHPDAQNSRFTHWSLERATPQPTEKRPRFDESFQEALSDEWMWQDPAGGAQRQIDNGLAIYTPNVRDLWWNFLTAPRLLHSIEGDFAIQTVCLPLRDDRPAIGGVLIWLDKRNYLRLDRGTRGPGEVSLQGCIDNEDVVFGRGSLLGERVWLRLEHAGDTVRGLCSADGDVWYSVGKVDFPAVGQIQAGIFAASNIDRTVYHGAYRDGTAIQFESVTMWEAEDGSRI